MNRPLATVLYLLYLVAFVGVVLELACRLGLLPNNAYTIHANLDRRKGETNVVVLGDSFSLETPVSASTLLRQHLGERGVATLNLAGGGYGPRNYLYQLRTYGLDYSPRIILLNYYVGNDLSDTMYDRQARVPLKRWASEWLRRSYFLGFVLDTRGLRIELARLREAEQKLKQATVATKPFNPLLFELAKAHPDYITINLLMESEAAMQAWAVNQGILRTIEALGKQHKARVLLTIFPATTQVNQSHLEFYRSMGFVVDQRTLTENKPQDLLNSLCKAEQWDCLDLLPAFRREGRDHTLYLVNDDHWDADGNALAYREMVAEIDRRGLLQ